MNGKRIGIGLLILLAAGVCAAVLLRPRRDVTTSSEEAYREYHLAQEDVQRLYRRDAQRHFEKAIAKDSHFAMAFVGLATMHVDDDPAQARRLLGRADAVRAEVTRRERLSLDLSRALVDDHKTEAEKLARTLIDDYHDFQAYEVLTRVLTAEGRGREVDGVLHEMLHEDPNHALAYNSLGYAAAYRGDYDEAIAQLKKYAFMAPDQANPFDSLGEIETACGRYDQAIADLTHALSIKPDFTPSLAHLGLLYEEKGEFGAAREYFQKSLTSTSSTGDHLEADFELVRIAIDQKNFDEARRVIAEVSSLKSEHYPNPAPLLTAWLVAFEGNAAAAHAQIKAISLPDSMDPKMRALIQRMINSISGRIEFNAGNYADALKLLESAINPAQELQLQDQLANMRVRALIARALARVGDREGARRRLEENRKINPNLWETVVAAREIEGGGSSS